MAFAAGQRILAAYLNAFRQGFSGLGSNAAQAVANTFEAWGDPIVFTNPGLQVSVSATASGYGVNNSDTEASALVRVEISFDGGSTWAAGVSPRADVGNASRDTRGSVAAIHQVIGTPTGDVRVRAMHFSSSTNTTFWSGALVATMMPTGD